MSAVNTEFPHYETTVKQLVKSHESLKDKPVLAIYYAPDRHKPEDIFLFEVIENFGGNAIDDAQEMLEAEYASTPHFLLAGNQLLHMVMTSPNEFEVAVNKGWRHVKELKDAIAAGNYHVVHKTPGIGDRLGAMIGV